MERSLGRINWRLAALILLRCGKVPLDPDQGSVSSSKMRWPSRSISSN
jgi:hypothetical protein